MTFLTVRLGPHEMLSRDQQATLVVFALDLLWVQTSSEQVGCCPRCCGPCEVIAQLVADDTLDHIVAQATREQRDSQWWDRDGETVDLGWLDRAWNFPPCPEHGQRQLAETQ